eukprot:2758083-Prymnesium_polylepis.1
MKHRRRRPDRNGNGTFRSPTLPSTCPKYDFVQILLQNMRATKFSVVYTFVSTSLETARRERIYFATKSVTACDCGSISGIGRRPAPRTVPQFTQ